MPVYGDCLSPIKPLNYKSPSFSAPDISKPPTFIEKHGLWGDEERRLAADIKRRVEAEKLRYVRLAWSDTHGYARAKTLTVPAFLSALTGGYNVGVATTTLAFHRRPRLCLVHSRRRHGACRDDRLAQSHRRCRPENLPHPAVGARRRLDFLVDEYFNDGTPFHFAPRQLLRKALHKLAGRGGGSVIGAEIEWYLFRVSPRTI